MLKRRLKQGEIAGALLAALIPGDRHHEENDGTLEAAQRIADYRTTKLYERRGQKVRLRTDSCRDE